MSSFVRAALFLVPAGLYLGIPAQAQWIAELSPEAVGGSATLIAPSDYTGQVRYGDTGRPAAGVRVYFEVMYEGDNDNTPTYAVTTNAKGFFRISRGFSFRRDNFISIEVDDPRNRYAAEFVNVVQVNTSSGEALPEMDLTFPTLTQDSIVSDDPYPNGVLHFVPNSAWQSKPSTFITLETGTFVSGTVTDASSGRPLSGIPVYTYGPHNYQPFGCLADGRPVDAYAAVTDNAGQYRLPVAPGQDTLAINHMTSNKSRSDNHTVSFFAVRGKTGTANLALSPAEIARLKRDESDKQKRDRVAANAK